MSLFVDVVKSDTLTQQHYVALYTAEFANTNNAGITVGQNWSERRWAPARRAADCRGMFRFAQVSLSRATDGGVTQDALNTCGTRGTRYVQLQPT